MSRRPRSRKATRQRWREGCSSAPVAAGAGLASVPDDYFDAALVAKATAEPRKAARIVGGTMAHERALMQVGDVKLLARLSLSARSQPETKL